MIKKDKIATEQQEVLEKEEPLAVEQVMTEDSIENEAIGAEVEPDANGQKLKESTQEEILNLKIEQLQEQVAELKDRFVRKVAEFTNYKRRTAADRLKLIDTAAKDTLTALLPVLDDFDRAKKVAEDDNTTEVFTEGVQLVYDKLYSVLQKQGLKSMETTGQPFDPDLHEALTEIPAPTEELKGKIIDTIEKGYYLKDKIIRHAKVVVGK